MVRLLSYSLPALWLAAFPFRGKLRPGGFRKLFASIGTKLSTGTRSETPISEEGSSSLGERGELREAQAIPQTLRSESSSTAGSFSTVIWDVGELRQAGLTRLSHAVFGEPLK